MHDAIQILSANLLSPLILAFFIGILAALVKSELEFPRSVLNAISIYLVFAIALKGGVELGQAGFREIWLPALGALLVTVGLPFTCYAICKKLLGFDTANAAAVSALYSSVSSVTFIAALSFAERVGTPAEPFMPVLVSIMEWSILVSLFIARWRLAREQGGAHLPLREIFIDTLRGRSVILIVGGLSMGALIGEPGFNTVKIVYEDAFRGILLLFLMEMGMVAARELQGFLQVGWKMLGFATVMPLLHGMVGVLIGKAAELSTGGCFVFGAMMASSSYIDAPAAVRASLPQANPGIYLTSSLGITFPFNLLVGLPLYYTFARWIAG